MTRTQFLRLLGPTAAAVGQLPGSAAQRTGTEGARKRPNIILILTDDLGYGDLGCYGQEKILTPNLDRLAREGVRFSQAYAGSTVCAPSRCCLMTGNHTGHARTRGNKYPDLPLRPSDITATELLKQAGYRTALFGKWSLGQLGSTGYPTRKGFDEWFGFFSQLHAHNYYPEHLLEGDHAYICRGNMGTQKKDYASDLFGRRALDFIARQTAAQPFFLHLSLTTPHANNEMGRDTGNGMEVPTDAPYSDQPWPQPEKNFAAMITRMDADIGRMMEALRQKGLDGNTVIFFTSDNGPHKEGGHNPDFFRSSGPLRGIKRDMSEGGIRVPLLARWPGRIKPGQVSDFPCAFWDFLPTMAELAGVPAPSGIDGRSFVPTLVGKPQKPAEYFYWEFHERGFHQAVRMGDWKGIRLGPKEPISLYNLASDVSERHDVAARNPEVVRRISGVMDSARTDSPDWPVLTAEEARKRAI